MTSFPSSFEPPGLPEPSDQEAHLRAIGLDAISRRSDGDLTAACDLLAAASNPGAVVALASLLEAHDGWVSGHELPVRALVETRCPGTSWLLARVARPWPRDEIALAHLCRVLGARREPEALPFLLELARETAPGGPDPHALTHRKALCALAAFDAPEAHAMVARALDRPGDRLLESELLHAAVVASSPAAVFALLAPWFGPEGRSRVGKAASELARHAERGGALDPRWREIVLPRFLGGDPTDARYYLPELVAATASADDLVDLLRGGARTPLFITALTRSGAPGAGAVLAEVIVDEQTPNEAVAVAAAERLRLGGALDERERRALASALADRAAGTVARALEAAALLPIDDRRATLKVALAERRRAATGEPDLERIRGDMLVGEALEAAGGEPPEPASTPGDGRYPFLFYGVSGVDFFEGGYAYEIRFERRPSESERVAILMLLEHGQARGDATHWADDWLLAEARSPISPDLAHRWEGRLRALHDEFPLLEVHGLCWPHRDRPPDAWETWTLARQPLPSSAPAWQRPMRRTPFEPLIKRYPATIE
ncbi:MAG TPA: hypothetical protein VFS43_36615 [Polyangiaceae bacterium]|nr:hypothetical protein [Polyangiaceae bacterium]